MTDTFDEDRLRSLLAGAANAPSGAAESDAALSVIRLGAARRVRTRRVAGSLAGIALVAGGIGVGLTLRPSGNSDVVPQPYASQPTSTLSPSPVASAPTTKAMLPAGFHATAVDASGGSWYFVGQQQLLVSDDEGRSFSRVAMPSGWAQAEGAGTNPGVRFVDKTHGIVWAGRTVWTTGDRGDTWSAQALLGGSGSVVDSEIAPGAEYLLVQGACEHSAPEQCFAAVATFSSDGSLTTSNVALPVGEQARSITQRWGSDIFVLSLDGSGAAGHLLISSDGGGHFNSTPFRSGCLTATLRWSSHTMWGVCATGTLAHVIRSDDGAKTFTDVPGPQGVANSADLVALSDQCALVTSETGIQASCDEGQTWTRDPQPAALAQMLSDTPGERLFALVPDGANCSVCQSVWIRDTTTRTWRVFG